MADFLSVPEEIAELNRYTFLQIVAWRSVYKLNAVLVDMIQYLGPSCI